MTMPTAKDKDIAYMVEQANEEIDEVELLKQKIAKLTAENAELRAALQVAQQRAVP